MQLMDHHRGSTNFKPVSDRRQDIGVVVRDGLEDPHDMNFGDYQEVKLLKLDLSQKGWVLVKGERQKDDHHSGHLNYYVDHQRIHPIICAVGEGTWMAIPIKEISGDSGEVKVFKSREEAGYDVSSLECYHLGGVSQDKWSVTVVKPNADEHGNYPQQTIELNGADILLCSSSLPHTGPVPCALSDREDGRVLHLRYQHFSKDLVYLPPCYEAIDARYPASVRFLVPRPSELAKLEKEEVVEED